MNGNDVAELRQLLAGSTPGKWKTWGMTVMADQADTSNVEDAVEVAQTFYRDEHGKPRTWDADLICHLQRNAEVLIDAAEAVERVRALLRETLHEYWKNPSGAALVTVGDVEDALDGDAR